MYTYKGGGVNSNLVQELEECFIWETPLTEQGDDSIVLGPEDQTEEQIKKAFEELEAHTSSENSKAILLNPILEDSFIKAGTIFNLSVLDEIDRGMKPLGFTGQINIHTNMEMGPGGWNIETLLREKGLQYQCLLLHVYWYILSNKTFCHLAITIYTSHWLAELPNLFCQQH